MTLSHDEIMRVLFAARPRLGAAAFVIARDAQAAEDIFQNVALKALTKEATFEHEGALLSWATVSARREALDWLRRRKPEIPVLDNDVLDQLQAFMLIITSTDHDAGLEIAELSITGAGAPP